MIVRSGMGSVFYSVQIRLTLKQYNVYDFYLCSLQLPVRPAWLHIWLPSVPWLKDMKVKGKSFCRYIQAPYDNYNYKSILLIFSKQISNIFDLFYLFN